LKGGSSDPITASKIMVYTLAQAFSISPVEVYNMPVNLALDMLTIHKEFKTIEMEEIEKAQRSMK
tara:strand:+ start:87 stop:281 length:195 start_codon:yes stop_codon:yes gene_type:complete